MIDRADLVMVLQVMEHGSLSGAARALDLAPPVVTKRLAALEARIGVRLFHRTTRRVSPTAEGRQFLQHARHLAEGFNELEQTLTERAHELQGPLRLCSSFGFGRAWVAPLVAQFSALHPHITVQLHLSEHLPDLAAAGLDAAVWLWSPRDTSMVSRRLAANRRVVVAAPGYIERHGAPQTPAELSRHTCLVVRENDDRPALWRLQALARPQRDVQTVRVSGPLSSNSGEVVREWALRGHGLMLRSLWDVHEHLASGALVHLLPEYAMLDADVQFLMPARAAGTDVPKRLRALQDHLSRALADPPWLSVPAGAPQARARRAPRPPR